jgi:hypothetical protein
MTDDWLLVETLGREPAVVAVGRERQDMIPITAFLKRKTGRAAIQSAIAESMQTSKGLVSITPKRARVIRTEPVLMSDGRIHGVHVWSGPPEQEPPERPVPGPLKWDMTLGVATDTPDSLANMGRKVEMDDPQERAFAECWPSGELKPNEGRALAAAVGFEPGHTMCDTWDGRDWQGEAIRVSFVVRSGVEEGAEGREHMVARGMNWRAVPADRQATADRLAQQILRGLAEPGVHRALFDPHSWTLLKWLDAPCPFYDWRRIAADSPRIHPDDEAKRAGMRTQFADGPAWAVLRLPAHDGGWVPIHVTVNRVELDGDTFAGLVSVRLPTPAEISAAGLPG